MNGAWACRWHDSTLAASRKMCFWFPLIFLEFWGGFGNLQGLQKKQLIYFANFWYLVSDRYQNFWKMGMFSKSQAKFRGSSDDYMDLGWFFFSFVLIVEDRKKTWKKNLLRGNPGNAGRGSTTGVVQRLRKYSALGITPVLGPKLINHCARACGRTAYYYTDKDQHTRKT